MPRSYEPMLSRNVFRKFYFNRSFRVHKPTIRRTNLRQYAVPALCSALSLCLAARRCTRIIAAVIVSLGACAAPRLSSASPSPRCLPVVVNTRIFNHHHQCTVPAVLVYITRSLSAYVRETHVRSSCKSAIFAQVSVSAASVQWLFWPSGILSQ